MGLRLDSGNAVNWGHSLNRGLVSWWLALPDQQRGVMFRDLCKRNHGTLTGGPTWQGARGRPGGWGSVGCTGGAYILSPEMFILTSAEDFTLRVVHRPTSYPSGFTALFDNVGTRRWNIFLNSSGDVSFVENVLGATATSLGMTTGLWWDVVWSRLSGTLTTYVNGVSKGAGASTTHTDGINAAIGFGNNLSGGGGHYDGCYAEMEFWRRGLSGPEVFELYTESRRGYPGLLNWHRPLRYAPEQGGAVTAFPWHYYQQMQAMAG